MTTRSDRAAHAVAHLAEVDPALGALALWCDIVDAPADQPGTVTTGSRISVGADFTALPLREQIGVLGHHVLHVALRHSARQAAMAQRTGEDFQPGTYTLAADAIVNECLEQAGHALPRPSVLLRTLLVEVLREPAEGALGKWDVDRLYGALRSLDGDGASRQENYRKYNAFRDDLEASYHHGATGEDDAAAWQGHLTRAETTGRGPGRGIGPILAKLADRAAPETPWELHLRGLLARAVSEVPRRSHRRPDRTSIAAEAEARRIGGPTPVFVPGRARDARRPRIAVGLDTSGSITDGLLARFAAEIAGIARRSGAETHVLSFDETVYEARVLGPGAWEDAITGQTFRRGGGTSFIDVMARAAQLAPSITVILTDLDGAFGPAPPGRVVWATPQAFWHPPPFGTVLSLAR